MSGRWGRAWFVEWAGRILHVFGRISFTAVGISLLVAAVLIAALSQTVVGRQMAADYAERALSGVIDGEVRIGPIIGGNLISRVHLAHLSIMTHEGVRFVDADSVRLQFNPLSFLLQSFRIRNMEAQRLHLNLEQDAAGSWNFDRLFSGDDSGGDESGAEGAESAPGSTRVLLSDLKVVNGRIRVRTPWDDPATRRRRTGSDQTIWRVLQTGPRRWERVIELDSLAGSFPLVRLVDPLRPMRFELSQISAVARAVTQDLTVRRFDGNVTFRERVDIEIERLEFEQSQLSGTGYVVPTNPTQYRFDLEARPFAFAEMQWLPIPKPNRGDGTADISLFTRGRTVMVDLRGGDVHVDDSRVTGGFRLALDNPARFESMDLNLQPLRIALLDEILVRDSLIDGYIRGPVRGSGPIDLLQLDAELQLSDLDGDTPESEALVRGRLSIGEPRQLDGLQVNFRNFEPRWTGVIGLPTTLGGRLEGRAEFNGHVGGDITFTSDVEYRTAEAGASRLTGGGSVGFDDPLTMNVQFEVDPLSLTVVDPYVPGLDLVGDVRGPILASGSLSDLQIVADLRTPRGRLNFDGRFDVSSEEKAYDATLLASDIQLRQWATGLPSTQLALRGRVEGVGTDPRTLRARFDLEILPSLFEGARVDSSLLRFSMEDGMARVDTFAIRTDVGSVDGFGVFGLAEDRSGSLILDLAAPDISTWNRWVVPGRQQPGVDADVDDLFAEFEVGPQNLTDGPAETIRDTLAGSLAARGVLFGNIHDYSFGGRLIGLDTSFGSVGADSLQMTVDIADPTVLDTLVVRTTAWGAAAARVSSDSLFVRWQRIGPADSDLEFFSRRDSTVELDVHMRLHWTETLRRVDADRLSLRVGSEWLRLAAPTRLQWGDAGLAVRDLRLIASSGGVIAAHGTLPDSGSANLSVSVRDIRLQDLFSLADSLPAIEGTVQADLQMAGTVGSPQWDLRFDVQNPGLAGLSYPLIDGRLQYRDRAVTLGMSVRDAERLLARAEGTIRADLAFEKRERRLLDDPVDVKVIADSLPMNPIELAFETLEDVEGYVRGEVVIGGRPGAFDYRGSLTFEDVESTLPALGIRLLNIRGDVAFEGSDAVPDTVRFTSSAGGSGFVTGRVGLSTLTNPEFDLDIGMEGLRAMERRQLTMTLTGAGNLAGTYKQPILTGAFRVSDGELRGDYFLRQRRVVDLTDPEVFALIDTTTAGERNLLRRAQNPFLQEILLNVQLTVGPSYRVRSREYEVELVGDVDIQMQRSTDLLIASGVLQLTRGKYQYFAGRGEDLTSVYSRQLQVSGGTVTFVRTPGLDPILAIRAEYPTRSDVGPLTIYLDIGGTSRSPELHLSSNPQVPESDLLCLLLFSASCAGAGTEGGQFAENIVREGILGTVGTQFSQVLVGDIGLVDYADFRSTGLGRYGSSSGSTSPLLVGTEVEVGRYLGRNLFVRVRQPLGGGQLPSAALEWNFYPGWQLEANAEDRFQRLSILSSLSNVDTKRSYGLFLKREWSF